jgi:hypothetical protein
MPRNITVVELVVIGVMLYVTLASAVLAFRQPELTQTQRFLCTYEALTWQRCEVKK